MRPAQSSRVLVTGAAGFIGSHLCERLLADGHLDPGCDAHPLDVTAPPFVDLPLRACVRFLTNRLRPSKRGRWRCMFRGARPCGISEAGVAAPPSHGATSRPKDGGD